jgi:glycosyltransferase involved in cell wall biosynthesis
MYKVPWVFARNCGISSLVFEAIRSGNIELQIRLSCEFRSAVLKAKRIWTITENEASIIDKITNRTSLMIETAPPAGIKGYVRSYDGTRPLRICWSGMHEARKALPLLLQAIALLPTRERIAVDILGEGPESPRWQSLARKLSLSNITWHGLLPYQKAQQEMGKADILVHTSFREGTPHVVLEAISLGMPVICHDACGMAAAVNATCGIKVPLINPDRSIRGFQDAIDLLLRNPELVEQLSRGALLRAAELSWDAKVRDMSEAYIQE